MRKIMLTLFGLLITVALSFGQGLEDKGPLFGSGLHLDWDPIRGNGVQQATDRKSVV